LVVVAPSDLKRLPGNDLVEFVSANAAQLTEDEALAVLENPYCTSRVCQSIAQNPRLVGFYSVRLRLVAHRATPQAQSVKLVHYLYWPDLIAISVDVKVPATVRRAADTQLLLRVEKLSLGERISSARRCSAALIKVFLFDRDPKVFRALLVNQLLREGDLLILANSPRAAPEQLVILASDPKWSFRYEIRKALVLNPATPRATAASQLRFLTRRDLEMILTHPETSVYVRRCIERMSSRKWGQV
jgi:hypothetical protein